ncbi:hypothetical protein D3C86_1659230 [compost metagenome]
MRMAVSSDRYARLSTRHRMNTSTSESDHNRPAYTADCRTDELSINVLILILSSNAPDTRLPTELRRMNPPTKRPIRSTDSTNRSLRKIRK